MANSCMSNCIICFCPFKSEGCKNPEYFTSVFNAFCRLLEIKIEGIQWNFEQDNIPFCDFCCSAVEKLKGLYDELDILQQKISNIFQATKHKILRSGSVTDYMPNELSSEEIDRVSYIRHQAMKSNSEEVTPQEETNLLMKVEIDEEKNNGNTSSLIHRINNEYEVQNQIGLNDSLDAVNNEVVQEAACIEDNNFSSEDVKGAPDLVSIPSQASSADLIGSSCTTPDKISTDPDDSNKCSYCQKIFRRKCSLKLHLKCHLEEQQHECENCDEIFETKNTLELHRRETHNKEAEYRCRVCHKGFNSPNDLKRHASSYHGVKPFKCHVCNKRFTQKCNLTYHMRIHTGEMSYTCDTCDQCFTRQSYLVAHKRVHTGERPYKCDTCDKCFAQKHHLTVHTRIHTGEKHYKCDTCGYCCNDPTVLKRHIRIHTGEKPYKCEVCGHFFRTESNFRRHKRIHTG